MYCVAIEWLSTLYRDSFSLLKYIYRLLTHITPTTHHSHTIYFLSTIMSFLTIYTSPGAFDRMMILFFFNFTSVSSFFFIFRFLSFNLYQFHFFSFLISRFDKSNFPNYTHNVMYSIYRVIVYNWRCGWNDDNGKNLNLHTFSLLFIED